MKVICDYCGKEFRRNPARLKYKHHFCSRYCAGCFMTGTTYTRKKKSEEEKVKITKICVICGKDISYRGHMSCRCEDCQKYYENAKKRAGRKRKYPTCLSCGDDIRKRNPHAMYCYECLRKRNIECCKRYHKLHREIHTLAQRKYYQKNKKEINRKGVIYQRKRKWKLKRREYDKEYYRKNKKQILKKTREYTKKNRTKINAYQRKWHKENIARCKEYARRYRNKQKGKKPTKICIGKTTLFVLPDKEYDKLSGRELIENYRLKK